MKACLSLLSPIVQKYRCYLRGSSDFSEFLYSARALNQEMSARPGGIEPLFFANTFYEFLDMVFFMVSSMTTLREPTPSLAFSSLFTLEWE